MTKYLPFLIFLCFLIPHQARAAVFYLDWSTATACTATNDGTATSSTKAYCSLQQFTDVARNAGDILYVRRGQASTTNVTAASFTSDGTLNAPITVSADYDNLWGDNATSTATFTPKFGEVYVAASASSTGTLGPYPRNWIYFQGDCFEQASTTITKGGGIPNPCTFAYEVKLASSTGIELYLPYKGNQSGSGINTRVMPFAPQIGSLTEANQIFSMSSDDYWVFKGLDVRSTHINCPVIVATNRATMFYDMVIQANGAGDCGLFSPEPATYLVKSRIFNVANGIINTNGITMRDSLIDCNSVASAQAFGAPQAGSVYDFVYDTAFKNCNGDFLASSLRPGGQWLFRNVRRTGSSTIAATAVTQDYFEDDFGTVGLNAQSSNQSGFDAAATTTISTTTVTRSGGGPATIYIMPPKGTGNTGLSTKNLPFSYLKIFEGRFYASASKTYTLYFRSASSSAFLVNPLTATATGSSTPELYIECEYYNHASYADRFLKRSNTASAVNFNTDTNWYAISVTCAPTQAGQVMIRAWYAKPKENLTNEFYMDTTVVVS